VKVLVLTQDHPIDHIKWLDQFLLRHFFLRAFWSSMRPFLELFLSYWPITNEKLFRLPFLLEQHGTCDLTFQDLLCRIENLLIRISFSKIILIRATGTEPNYSSAYIFLVNHFSQSNTRSHWFGDNQFGLSKACLNEVTVRALSWFRKPSIAVFF